MEINYGAVLVCGVVALLVGFVWYGPLFGKAWMQIMGEATMTPEQKEAMRKNMWVMCLIQFVLSLITAKALAWHIYNWGDISTSALAIAVCTWFGFVMTTQAGAALWSGKPRNMALKMFLISAGGQFVTFIAFGLILSLW